MRNVKRFLTIALMLFLLSCTLCYGAGEWDLFWSDEFNGTSLDTDKWSYWQPHGEAGSYGGYLCDQSYIVVSNGTVKISVDKVNGIYKSCSLHTSSNFDVQYGRIEARMRMPDGGGGLGAFWTTGANDDAYDWPKHGEIDIIERTGNDPDDALGTIHFEQYGDHVQLPSPRNYCGSIHDSLEWNVYAIEWDQYEIRWYVGSQCYQIIDLDDAQDGAYNGFKHAHTLRLDMIYGLIETATGFNGTWLLPYDDDSLPQTLEVDYVRVYKWDDDLYIDPSVIIYN